jgi:hypothetical protein
VRGRLVKRLHNGPLQAGTRVLAWYADDATGTAVANGVYFAVVRAPGLHPEARVAKIVVGR